MGKKIIKDTLALVAIVLVAVLLLSFIHEITKERIIAAEQEEVLQSYMKVFPGASEFKTKEFSYEPSEEGVHIDSAMEAYDSAGNLVGCVVLVTSPNGYGGDISSSLGFDMNGVITGMTVTSMSETPGLGANCQKEDWQAQFNGKSEFPIVYVKEGKTAPNEIDALSGATKTTKAITDSVNYAYEFVGSVFGYGNGGQS